MLLLRLMSEIFPNRVRAIYIDHQLQSLSEGWGHFVDDICRQWNIECVVEKVNVAEGNLENSARIARYAAFKKNKKDDEILVLAHHQQDQAETVLLRLFSGAGVTGLSAMKAWDMRQDLTIWRPLLNISREKIELWAQQLNVPNIQDPTNEDTHYDRAWCRQELWPLLNTRFPRMQEAVVRASSLMQDADEILQEILAQDIQYCVVNGVVDVSLLNTLSIPRQKQLLSAWIKGELAYRPSYDLVQRVMNEVIHARQDAQAYVLYQPFYITRYQGKLYRVHEQTFKAVTISNIAQSLDIKLTDNQPNRVASGDYEICEHEIGLDWNILEKQLKLQSREGGEKIHLYGRVGSWPLKKAIQNSQICPWLRHTIQILLLDNVMLGVFTPQGFWLAESKYCVKNGWQPKLIKN